MMELRKLEREEHIRTRALWEAVFTEDSPEFLDYYYKVKAAENEIYAIEEDGEIVSMIHLNPYQMRMGDEIYQTHYIVAVATKEQVRGRGLMRSLLTHVLQVMKERGEPFTFLMPASEAIYKPFGFAFIYEQKRGYVTGKESTDESLAFRLATEADCKRIAEFANEFLKSYDVVAWRDAAYYRILLAEQESENGGILLAERNGKLSGVFCFTRGERLEIREPLCENRDILEYAVRYLTGNETERAFCTGYGEETKPVIMAKILHPEMAGDFLTAKVFLNEVV